MVNNKTKTLLGIVAFALLLSLATFFYQTLSPEVSPLGNLGIASDENIREEHNQGAPSKENEDTEKLTPAPDFSVLNNDGDRVSLSDLFGKPIVLNFWASWCSPCKSEMPDFHKVYKEMGEEVTFVMVNLTDGKRETEKTAKSYITKEGFTFPVYFDTEQEAAYAFGVSSVPTTYFLDEKGNILTGVQGPLDEDTLRTGIELINKPTP